MENSHIVHEVGTREDTNGPWMVIMRRRNGTKKDSRSNPTTLQTQLGIQELVRVVLRGKSMISCQLGLVTFPIRKAKEKPVWPGPSQMAQ